MLKTKARALLIVILLAAAAAACSEPGSGGPAREAEGEPAFSPYSRPIVLSIAMEVDPNYKSYTGETPASNPWIRAIRKELNVDVRIDWFATSENMEQRIDLAISGNALPDAMVVSRYQFSQMVEAGELADLTELYPKYASPAMKRILESAEKDAMRSATRYGRMLALPSANPEDFSMMWIRKDWLDRLGLEPPASMKELELVAKAFVEEDPDGNGRKDTIGIAAGASLYDAFHAGPGSFDLNPIFSAYQAYPGFWLRGEDGQPAYGSIQPETRNALAALQDLYAKGLIDREMGMRETEAEVVINGKAGIFFAPSFGGDWSIPEALKNNSRADWQAYALPLDAEGRFNAKVFRPTQSYVVVRKEYEHPEAVLKVVNMILRDSYKYGDIFKPLPHVLVPRDEIKVSVEAMRDVLAGRRDKADFKGMSEYAMLANDLETIRSVKRKPYASTGIVDWNTRDANFKRAYSLLVGGRNLLDPKVEKVQSGDHGLNALDPSWRRLLDEEKEVFTQIIMGDAPIEAFDRWVEEWKRQKDEAGEG
ncbi:extracellular solute-binding protein [Paenibacillus sp. FSL W8-1187]|uniref:Putative sugar binding protein, ABC transport system n=1 Tax=Paenibacillus pasadenensis TaxID=217090 RepID=A0A2N5NCK6_9BACL|nr:extracellular solute-binding protein [Paenibacillus pasadenensis]PLT48087.1 putative sugar binding protein, ABC transport system precursor [Paenibacillus pasadenensis]